MFYDDLGAYRLDKLIECHVREPFHREQCEVEVRGQVCTTHPSEALKHIGDHASERFF